MNVYGSNTTREMIITDNILAETEASTVVATFTIHGHLRGSFIAEPSKSNEAAYRSTDFLSSPYICTLIITIITESIHVLSRKTTNVNRRIKADTPLRTTTC